ncbi:MAG TPA: hypothetical protein VGH49_02030 [Xanthobacteraceae bacterium]
MSSKTEPVSHWAAKRPRRNDFGRLTGMAREVRVVYAGGTELDRAGFTMRDD